MDESDGSENNAVRRLALDLIARTIDDLSDVELVMRQPDEAWYIDLCIDTLHRLPSEVDPILGMCEYTTLHARSVVKRAQEELSRTWAGHKMPEMNR